MAPGIQTFVNSFQKRLEPPVRQHLKNVYGALTMTCGSACAGVYVDYAIFQAGLLSCFATLGFMLMILVTPDDYGKNTNKRLAYLLGFGLASGMGLGPLLAIANAVDPAILVTALLGATLVFVCFSIAAMVAERGSWLFLGGTLGTMMTSVVVMVFANIFMQSRVLCQTHLYLGLLVFCGYVLFDSQLIIEKCRLGNKDFVQHALELFIDFVSIFRRLLIILMQKEEDRRRKRE